MTFVPVSKEDSFDIKAIKRQVGNGLLLPIANHEAISKYYCLKSLLCQKESSCKPFYVLHLHNIRVP